MKLGSGGKSIRNTGRRNWFGDGSSRLVMEAPLKREKSWRKVRERSMHFRERVTEKTRR